MNTHRPRLAWLFVLAAVLLLGTRYWTISYAELNRADGVPWFAPWLVGVVGMLIRAFARPGFWRATLVASATLPLLYAIRLPIDWAADATHHNLWPIALVFLWVVSLGCAAVGAGIVSVAFRVAGVGRNE